MSLPRGRAAWRAGATAAEAQAPPPARRPPHACGRLADSLPAVYLKRSDSYWAPGGPRLPREVGCQRSGGGADRQALAACQRHLITHASATKKAVRCRERAASLTTAQTAGGAPSSRPGLPGVCVAIGAGVVAQRAVSRLMQLLWAC